MLPIADLSHLFNKESQNTIHSHFDVIQILHKRTGVSLVDGLRSEKKGIGHGYGRIETETMRQRFFGGRTRTTLFRALLITRSNHIVILFIHFNAEGVNYPHVHGLKTFFTQDSTQFSPPTCLFDEHHSQDLSWPKAPDKSYYRYYNSKANVN